MTDLKQLLVRNSLFNGIKLAASLVIGFLLPPFIIVKIGIQAYGQWTLVVAVAQLVNLIDFGFQPALMKAVAGLYKPKREEELNRFVATLLTVFLLGGTVFILLAALSGQWIAQVVFGASPTQAEAFGRIGLLMIFSTTLTLVSGVYTSVLAGLQRMDVAGTISTVTLIGNAVISVVLLIYGWDLWGLAAASVFSTAVTLVLAAVWSKRIYPSLSFFGLGKPSWRSLRELLVIGLSLGYSQIAETMFGQFIRFLIGMMAGVSMAAYYDLSLRFVTQLATIPLVISTPILPAAALLQAVGDAGRIRQLILRSLKYLNMIGLPLFAFSTVFADSIVRVWLGSGYETVSLGIQILAIVTYLNLLTGPIWHAAIGMGKVKFIVQFSTIKLIFGTLIASVLALLFQYWGVIFGYVLALLAPSVWLAIQFYEELGLSMLDIHRKTVGYPFLLMISLSVPFGILWTFASHGLGSSRMFWLAVMFAAYTLAFWASLVWKRLVSWNELWFFGLEIRKAFLRR